MGIEMGEIGDQQAVTLTLVAAMLLLITGALYYKHNHTHGKGKGVRGDSGPSRKNGINHLPPDKRPGAFEPKKGYGSNSKGQGKKK